VHEGVDAAVARPRPVRMDRASSDAVSAEPECHGELLAEECGQLAGCMHEVRARRAGRRSAGLTGAAGSTPAAGAAGLACREVLWQEA